MSFLRLPGSLNLMFQPRTIFSALVVSARRYGQKVFNVMDPLTSMQLDAPFFRLLIVGISRRTIHNNYGPLQAG